MAAGTERALAVVTMLIIMLAEPGDVGDVVNGSNGGGAGMAAVGAISTLEVTFLSPPTLTTPLTLQLLPE